MKGAGFYTEHGRQSVDDGLQEHQNLLCLTRNSSREAPGSIAVCMSTPARDVSSLMTYLSHTSTSEASLFRSLDIWMFLDDSNGASRFHTSGIVTISFSR